MFYIAYKKEKLKKGEKVNIKIVEEVEKDYLKERGYEIINLEKGKKVNIEVLSTWLHTEIFGI